MDISAKFASLELQTCIQNVWDAKTQEMKGYDDSNYVYTMHCLNEIQNTAWIKAFTSGAVKSSLEK